MCNLLKSSVTFAIVIVKQKKCHEYALKCNVIIFFLFSDLKAPGNQDPNVNQNKKTLSKN